MAEDALKKKREEHHTGAETAPTFYANSVNVAVSPFDMRMRFVLIEGATDERIDYRTVATVFLSPAQARALRELLNRKAAVHDAIWTQKPTITGDGEEA